ncbi:MAG TPA: hypothetical protein VGD60_19755 [Candidatus Acidoferrales bacterium]
MTHLIDYPTILFIFLFVTYAVALEIGFRLASRRNANQDPTLHEQAVGVRDGVIVLLSLLLGFTLALALPRNDLRRQLIVDEANSIGTTSLRAELLPEPARSKSLALLRDYVNARLQFSEHGPDSAEAAAATVRSRELQAQLWDQAKDATTGTPAPVISLYMTALNDTIDLESKRLAARRNRVPISIWIMLFLISILACLSFGFSLRRRFLLSMIVTPLMIAIVMALIADLDTPIRGFIRVDLDSLHQLQSDLHNESAKPQP